MCKGRDELIDVNETIKRTAAERISGELLLSDVALHADIFEAFSRGDAEVVYESADALLVRLVSCGLYMIAARDAALGRRLYDEASAAAGDDFEAVVRGSDLPAYAAEIPGMGVSEPCTQIYYDKPLCEHESGLVVRHPDERDFTRVAETYRMREDALREHFNSPQFYGGYLDGVFVGYMGAHSEGSLGMLHVFEEYRRRGYAEIISERVINARLADGHIPYVQVYTSNSASLALQHKLGAHFSRETITWSWKK